MGKGGEGKGREGKGGEGRGREGKGKGKNKILLLPDGFSSWMLLALVA